jgi:uncharacterized protein (TIGR02246 family)
VDEDERAIRKLFAEWGDAVAARDVEQLLTLITEDAVFLAPGQEPIRGKVAVEALYRQVLSLYRFEQNWVFEEIQVLGDWAYCWGRDSVTMTPLGSAEAAVRASGMGLSILRRQPNGSWAVARGINNMTRDQSSAESRPN